jgi:hypothetical protein
MMLTQSNLSPHMDTVFPIKCKLWLKPSIEFPPHRPNYTLITQHGYSCKDILYYLLIHTCLHPHNIWYLPPTIPPWNHNTVYFICPHLQTCTSIRSTYQTFFLKFFFLIWQMLSPTTTPHSNHPVKAVLRLKVKILNISVSLNARHPNCTGKTPWISGTSRLWFGLHWTSWTSDLRSELSQHLT